MLSKYYYRLLTPQSQRNDRPDEDIPLRTEKALDAISNARRRAVIIEVAGRGTPVTLSTLSETIAADELELFDAWVFAKEQNHLGDDDPVPYGALRGVAVRDGVVDRDDLVRRSSGTGRIVKDDDTNDVTDIRW
jgi:hypothetical protein